MVFEKFNAHRDIWKRENSMNCSKKYQFKSGNTAYVDSIRYLKDRNIYLP